MLQQLNFNGKTAFVTGANRGIGLAIATKLAEYGATVALAGRNLEATKSAAQQIRNKGGDAFAIHCEVSSFDSVSHAINEARAHTVSIDFLINNAGVIEPLTRFIDSDPELWAQAVDINFKGVYHCMRAAIPHMIEHGSGTVVNISSGAANSALPGWSHYCSTKAAAKKLTEVAHNELHDKNIRVIGLSPGTIATDMMAKIKESKINAVSELDWASHRPPEVAAEAVAFLCGPEGDAYCGTDFSIKTKTGLARVGLPTHDI